jgi:hypothetical protein
MENKTNLNDIIDAFLTACAESEGLTEPEEITEYVKDRKKRIEDCIVKKDAE